MIPHDRYIRFVCRVLDMPVPLVTVKKGGRFQDLQGNLVFDEPFDANPLEGMTCRPERNHVYLDLDQKQDWAYYDMAHALRECWQARTLQDACQVDADAFARLVHSQCFGGQLPEKAQTEQVKVQMDRLYAQYPGRYISECFYKTK